LVAGGPPSRWVQYATRGTGFLPVHETHRTLPAGCYRLERADLYGRDVLIEPATLLADEVTDFGEGPASEILGEIDEFWSLAADYLRMGCVHKRGYLFWGPPGSGKSSLVAAIVRSHLKRDGIVLLVN